MNSKPKPSWLTLTWWSEQDHRVKTWFANFGANRHSWTEEERTRAIAQLGHAIGWSCLATPLITWWLYPWLPQPNAALFLLWGATSLSGSLVAHMKLSDLRRTVSASPHAAEKSEERRIADDDHHHPGA